MRLLNNLQRKPEILTGYEPILLYRKDMQCIDNVYANSREKI